MSSEKGKESVQIRFLAKGAEQMSSEKSKESVQTRFFREILEAQGNLDQLMQTDPQTAALLVGAMVAASMKGLTETELDELYGLSKEIVLPAIRMIQDLGIEKAGKLIAHAKRSGSQPSADEEGEGR
jgi:hypothetical protein